MANFVVHEHFPKTLLGFFMSLYTPRADTDQCQTLKPKEVLIEAHKHNSNMPENIKLLCGDLRLHCAEESIRAACNYREIPINALPPWVKQRLRLLEFLKVAALESEKETVVFIDTNPTLDIFMEIALMTANKLVVPVMSDDYSTAALRKIVYLLYGVGCSKALAIKQFEETTFWSKVRQYNCKVARVHTVMFNKCNVRAHTLIQAQGSIWEQQCEVLLSILNDVCKSGVDANDVFNFDARRQPKSASTMGNMFGCHMTDMQTAGIICMRCGLPLWMLRRNRQAICEKMKMTHGNSSIPLR